jgi:TolB-like protein
MGFLDLILEGPHALPFMVSRRGNQEQSIAEMWMEDIIILKQRCHRIEVLAVPTMTNQAVVKLVGHPSFSNGEQVWLEDFHDEIQGFL